MSGQDPTEAELVEAAGLVLRRKRVELEIRLALRRALKSNRDPRVSAAAAMLAEARTELVRLELGGPRGSTIAEHQRRLLEAGLAIEQSETELAELLPDLNLAATLQSFTVSGVAGALPVGAVLVDIVRIDEINLDPGGQRYVRNVARERYVALVLRAGSRKVALVPLADACVIDQMVHDFRAAIISGDSEIGVGVALHGELIAPLMPHVGDARTVYLAPDADLFELPFDAVPLEDGRRLADLWQITYLTSGRELLLEGNLAPEATARPALVVGDPDFDMGSHLPVEVPPVFASAGLSFERLDYTRGEAEQVATALGVVPLLGPGATESAVKATHSPHVLHLATHGFFLPVPPHTDLASGPDPDTWMSTDPLLRSGLLLAGSRTWCRGGDSGDAEDGLLTAEDVVQMDLRGTRLVVLSACESGRGIVESGEGMQGLRSAFQIAGASWVVMSLWQVGDEITAELMESFYAAFTAGQEPSSALASAQAQIRRRRPNQPFAWAAFICQGPRA